MDHETSDRAELEKIEAFAAVLLSEQLGPLSTIQRDLLETIQNAAGRLTAARAVERGDYAEQTTTRPERLSCS